MYAHYKYLLSINIYMFMTDLLFGSNFCNYTLINSFNSLNILYYYSIFVELLIIWAFSFINMRE